GVTAAVVPSGVAAAIVPSGMTAAVVPSGVAAAIVPSGMTAAAVPSGVATAAAMAAATAAVLSRGARRQEQEEGEEGGRRHERPRQVRNLRPCFHLDLLSSVVCRSRTISQRVAQWQCSNVIDPMPLMALPCGTSVKPGGPGGSLDPRCGRSCGPGSNAANRSGPDPPAPAGSRAPTAAI